MPNLLTKLRIRAVAIVPKGANVDEDTEDGAHILIRKAANAATRPHITVSQALATVRQMLRDHGLEGSEADRYLCELNRRAVLKGSVLDGVPVVDTDDVNRSKDQRLHRRTLMAFHDRAIAKMRAGTSASAGLSAAEAEERFHRENPDWYAQYRATFA
jgi:hypothetical protein